MTLLVTWLLFAAVSGAVARRKGRSVPLWTLLGFGSGVLALGVVSLLPGPQQPRHTWGVATLMRAAEHLADRAA